MEQNMDIMYSRIRERREKLGMSQQELADKTGYSSRTTIAKIEAGKIDLTHSKLIAFAKALQTTSGYILGWDWDAIDMTLTDDEATIISAYRETSFENKHTIKKYLGIWNNTPPEEKGDYNLNLIEITTKYLSLGTQGREMVDMVLDKECERARIQTEVEPEPIYELAVARGGHVKFTKAQSLALDEATRNAPDRFGDKDLF